MWIREKRKWSNSAEAWRHDGCLSRQTATPSGQKRNSTPAAPFFPTDMFCKIKVQTIVVLICLGFCRAKTARWLVSNHCWSKTKVV